MKKFLIIISTIAVFSLSACGITLKNNDNESNYQTSDTSINESTKNSEHKNSNIEKSSKKSNVSDTLNNDENNTDTDSNPASPIEVSYELKKITASDDSGNEIAYVTFPEFTVNTDGFSKLNDRIDEINTEISDDANSTLSELKDYYENGIKDHECFQDAYSVDILKSTSKIISIMITSEWDAGGPHPDIISKNYNIDPQTGENININDVINVSSDMSDSIAENLISDYPELTLPDESTLSNEVYVALENNNVEWNISNEGDGIVINFLNSGILESTFNVPDFVVEIKFNDNPDYFKMTF